MIQAVFDSPAVVTMLLQQRGWQPIHRVISNPDVQAILAGPTLTECVTVARRLGNQSSGAQIWASLSALGVRIESATADDLLRAAELQELSDDNPGPDDATLSLGDALILAVADRLHCTVITRDTYWKWMVDQGLLSIHVHVP